ncbi:hypothetical protein [Cellulomonas sp. IC4_254]|uniref:hypothetical protein n=1 Tax=Cellulomonas sp. IC4_254 TaxID=2714040 RepID=UPI0014212877|nr:hypothetical protein [Cellulomonas sp. IC4_254]NHT16748.1 hypothetical protein [Cellulomonas sp. IC4_254]
MRTIDRATAPGDETAAPLDSRRPARRRTTAAALVGAALLAGLTACAPATSVPTPAPARESS